ncbi:MAG: response regulator transcription factor [Bacteroidota bacterium]
MISEKGNILIVEDEENLHKTLRYNLEMEEYSITSAYTGTEAIKAIDNEYFDLIILDLMLPELDGISIIENVRVKNIDSPILILSAKSSSADRILGLKKGADDYLTKPFNLQELLLRVDKLIIKTKKIRNTAAATELNTYSFGGNTVDFNAQTAVTFSGNSIELSKKESLLLKLLIENKGNVVTREKILQVVWGYNVYPTTRTIDNFILNFRKNFELDARNPKYFQSIRGAGYKFVL